MFQPVIAGNGLAAWRLLQLTHDRQLESFARAPSIRRDTEYFADRIGQIRTAGDLVSDRRLLGVALGAFGLQDDINNTYFIRKILEEGTIAEDALANRFADTRYRDFSKAFGFGPNEVPRTILSGFPNEIIGLYKANGFEVMVGAQDDTLRTALYARRVLPELLKRPGSDRQKWFSVMGQPPLRAVFEKALNLPFAFSRIDIDQQLGIFKDRAKEVFGADSPVAFAEAELLENLVTRFVLRTQSEDFNASYSPQAIALALLRG